MTWRLEDIANAQTSEQVRGMEQPGFWESLITRKAYGITPKEIEAAKLSKIDQLQRFEAAPMSLEAARLKQFAAVDPETIGSKEGLADFAERPGFWLGHENSDNKQAANPYIPATLQQFAADNQNLSDMYTAMGDDPKDPVRRAQARLAMQEKLPQQFHQVMQGEDQRTNADKNIAAADSAVTAASDTEKFLKSVAAIQGGTVRPITTNGVTEYVPVDNLRHGDKTYVKTDTGPTMPGEEKQAYILEQFALNPNVPRELVDKVMDNQRILDEKRFHTTRDRVGRSSLMRSSPVLGQDHITKEDVEAARSTTNINGVARQTAVGVTDKGELVFQDSRSQQPPYKFNTKGEMVSVAGETVHSRSNATALADASGQAQTPSQRVSRFALSKNPEFQKRGIVLESLPESLELTRQTGKELKRSSFKLFAIGQDKMDDYTQDSKRTDYITNQNDTIQNLATVFRVVGMSEASIQMEKEAVSSTKTPKQFDRWYYQTVRQAIPRVARYVSKTGEGGGALQLLEESLKIIEPSYKPKGQHLYGVGETKPAGTTGLSQAGQDYINSLGGPK